MTNGDEESREEARQEGGEEEVGCDIRQYRWGRHPPACTHREY